MSKTIQYQEISKDFETQRIRLKMPNGFVFTVNPDLELLSLGEIVKQAIVTDKAFARFMAESERYTGIKLTQTSLVPDSELLAKKEAAANITSNKWINLNTKEEPCWVKVKHIKYVRSASSGIHKSLVYLSATKDYIRATLSGEEIMEQLNEPY